MGLFRRRETYNEHLLRRAGIDPAELLGARPVPVVPPQSVLAAVGLPDGTAVGPNDWDAATTTTVPGLAGDRVRFTVLPDGDLIVDEEEGNGDLSPLADAIEERLTPPYRAVAVRQERDLWGVGAKRIEVARIDFSHGDELELSRKDSWDELRVDGEPSDAKIPQLEQLGARVGRDFFVKAERVDGDVWKVRISPL